MRGGCAVLADQRWEGERTAEETLLVQAFDAIQRAATSLDYRDGAP
jgi:hypothetical protein